MGLGKKFIIGAITSFVLSNSSFASGIPTVDVAAIAQQLMSYQQQMQDYAMQIQQYEQMYNQLQQQVRMVENMATNLKSLEIGDLNWNTLNYFLNRSKSVMNKVDAISYDMENISSKIKDLYKTSDEYEAEINSASNEKERKEIYEKYQNKLRDINQNTLTATIEKLKTKLEDIEDEDNKVLELKAKSDTAEGNLQVIQAGNNLIAYQIDELKKLRIAMMDQTNVLANYLAEQNNQKILEQEKMDKIDNKGNWNNIYEKSNYKMSDFTKLPGGLK